MPLPFPFKIPQSTIVIRQSLPLLPIPSKHLTSALLTLALSLSITGNVRAIADAHNLGQWGKPTETGPDKDCPGFLVNLGPTGARAILKESSFVVKHVFPKSPTDGQLRIDDEITAVNGTPFTKHTFGKCYGMEPGAGYGTMSITTLMAMLSWELAEDCGIEIENFNRDLAYGCIHTHTHESGYMGYRFANAAYTPVGRQGLSIIVHQVANRPGTDAYVSRVTNGMAISKTRLNDGHGDNALAWGWALLGIQLSGNASATRAVFDYNKAFINMARTHDGAFVIQPGRNLHEKAYYMSPCIHPTAAMVLALGTDKPKLRIQGVNGKPQS